MGLSEDMKELTRIVKEQDTRKPKKFRLPFGKKVSGSQKKKNYITLIKINENGQIAFKKVQIVDQTFMDDEVPRLAAAGYVMYYKKNPMMILPSWSVEPFSPLEHYKQSLISGTNSVGYSLLMAKMKKELVGAKTPMGGWLKWIIILGLIGIVVYAIFFTGGN